MMREIAAQSGAGSRCVYTRWWLLGLCVTTAALSGCAERQVKAKTFPWSTAAVVRPRPFVIQALAGDQIEDVLPDAELEAPPPPSPLEIVPGMPPRPRVPVVPSGQSVLARPEPLQIVPELTAEETIAAQQQTNVSLSVAERNIGSAQGKNLNATQLDLASKVRSFITEARDAAHIGDWTRARNAARKAQVLSEELAGSL